MADDSSNAPIETVSEIAPEADNLITTVDGASEITDEGSLGKRKPEEDVEGEAPAKRTLNDCEEVVPDVGGDAPASEPQMGSATAVEDAPADGIVPVDPIMPVMPEVVTQEVDCPPMMVGRLIGKGGETIKSLESQNGAKIQIDQDTKKVSITGSAAAVANTLRAVNELLAAPSETQGGQAEASETLDCPPGLVGRIIGRGGETIKGLQAASGATISIDQNYPEHMPRKVHVSGSASAVANGCKMVQELLEGGPSTASHLIGISGISGQGFTMDCPKEMVGRVIGRGGETIKGLQQHSGARIQIDQSQNPCKVSITGNPGSMGEAQRMITEIINGGNAAQYSVNVPGPTAAAHRPAYPDPHYGGAHVTLTLLDDLYHVMEIQGGYGPPAGYSPYGGGYPGPAPGAYGGYAPPVGYGAPASYGGYGPPAAAPGGYDYGGYGGYQQHGGYDAAAYQHPGYGGGYSAPPAAAPSADTSNPWQALQDDQGRTYYYNSQTGVSQWEKPDGMP